MCACVCVCACVCGLHPPTHIHQTTQPVPTCASESPTSQACVFSHTPAPSTDPVVPTRPLDVRIGSDCPSPLLSASWIPCCSLRSPGASHWPGGFPRATPSYSGNEEIQRECFVHTKTLAKGRWFKRTMSCTNGQALEVSSVPSGPCQGSLPALQTGSPPGEARGAQFPFGAVTLLVSKQARTELSAFWPSRLCVP